MAAGHLDLAIPVFEDLVERVPQMSFPISSLLRAYEFQKDWDSVDRLPRLAEQREIREFEGSLPFIWAKPHQIDENIQAWRKSLNTTVSATGCIDVWLCTPRAGGILDDDRQVAGLHQ